MIVINGETCEWKSGLFLNRMMMNVVSKDQQMKDYIHKLMGESNLSSKLYIYIYTLRTQSILSLIFKFFFFSFLFLLVFSFDHLIILI